LGLQSLSPRAWIITACALCTSAGFCAGLFVRGGELFEFVETLFLRQQQTGVDADSVAGHDTADGHGSMAVATVTAESARTLRLKTTRLRKSDYLQSIRLPGSIVEKPGHSGRTVSSRVRGIVREVYCSAGQLLRPGDRLFRVQLSGDETITAQVSLLETRQLIEATTQELSRVRKLVERKTAPAAELIPIQMQLKRLERQGDLRRKELLVRGLSTELISDILASSELRDEFVMRVPGRDRPALDEQVTLSPGDADRGPETPVDDSDPQFKEFTVEEINVHPGQSISPGDQLADLAWHDQLAVEGHAFERDIAAISQLSQSGWKARIEYGSHGEEIQLAEFDVKFVDNHVDTDTGTFRFFLEINNEEFHSSTDARGRVFKSWRFKPGQRVHILIPVEQMKGQFVFPREALVQEGIDSFVFRRHSQTAEFDEYEAVPVTVLYRNSSIVVVASDGRLKENNRVAVNNAYQLYLATKTTDGQGHTHPHPH